MATLTDIPGPARLLGFAGAIPFVAGAVGVWALDDPWRVVVLDAQIYYGCVILSFLGAVHWGRALTGELDGQALRRPLAWGVMPSLIAWTAALVQPDLGLVVLIAGVFAAYSVDRSAVARGWFPAWYGVLRRSLSLLVILSLGVSLMRTLNWG